MSAGDATRIWIWWVVGLFAVRLPYAPHLIYKFLFSTLLAAPTNMEVYPFLPSFQQGLFTTAVGLLVYALVRVIYNVYFHPLSRFPGPRSAACTRWWLAYMELGRGVSLSTLRAELHQKYGTGSIPLSLFRLQP